MNNCTVCGLPIDVYYVDIADQSKVTCHPECAKVCIIEVIE